MINIQHISSAAYGAQSYKSAAKESGKDEAPPKSSVALKEQVELSDASQNLKKLQDTVKAVPEIRIALVEEIKQKIKYNGYPIESNLYKAIEKMIVNKTI